MITQHIFDPISLISELIFTILSVLFCFAIYHKTKEMYELSKYAGIKYFRDAFLFFALAYFLRFLFIVILFSRLTFDIILPKHILGALFILPLGYCSTAGIFYLIFSSIWKKFNNRKMLIAGHSIALALSLIAFVTRSDEILLLLQSLLLITAVILVFSMQKEKKRLTKIRILYLLVLALWLINLMAIGSGWLFPVEVKIIFQFVSLVVFYVLYSKIKM